MRVHESSCCALRANGPQPDFLPPFSTRGRAVRFDMRRIDHLHLGRSPTPGQFAKKVLPQPPPRPAHKAVINGCRRAIFGRAIAPAASALENMHDPADDPAIVYPLDTAHIARQIRPNSSPLLVAQPKQILAHDPDPLPKTNQDRILSAQKLKSFDPSIRIEVTFRLSGIPPAQKPYG